MEMKKKEYMIPVSEVLDLRAMSAMMDGPLFGPASVAVKRMCSNQ